MCVSLGVEYVAFLPRRVACSEAFRLLYLNKARPWEAVGKRSPTLTPRFRYDDYTL